jgi:hypothetical protein
MRMFPLPNGKFINPLQVTCCYTTQVEKNIFQSVFEMDNNKVLVSLDTYDEADKVVQDFVKFCDES